MVASWMNHWPPKPDLPLLRASGYDCRRASAKPLDAGFRVGVVVEQTLADCRAYGVVASGTVDAKHQRRVGMAFQLLAEVADGETEQATHDAVNVQVEHPIAHLVADGRPKQVV